MYVLIAAVVAMALTKKVKGKLPFTEEGYAAWRRGVLMNVLGWVGALALLFGGIFSFAGDLPALGGLCLVAMVALPITTYFVFARGRMLRCTEITATQITLELPSPSAVDAITRHLFAGTPAAAAAAAGVGGGASAGARFWCAVFSASAISSRDGNGAAVASAGPATIAGVLATAAAAA